MFIFVILAITFGLLAVLGKPFKVSERFGLKYTNTSGDTYNGTLDQRTYTSWKGIKVVKQKVSHMGNPQSAGQFEIRSAVERFAKEWNGLAEADKATWELFGSLPPQPNPESGIRAIIRRSTTAISGINAFIGANIKALVAGQLSTIPRANPHLAPLANSTYAITWPQVGEMHAVWADKNNGALTVMVACWITFVRKTAGGHKQLLAVTTTGTELQNYTSFVGKLGVTQNFADYVGEPILVQFECIDVATGMVSVPSNTIKTVVA